MNTEEVKIRMLQIRKSKDNVFAKSAGGLCLLNTVKHLAHISECECVIRWLPR